MNQGSNSWMMDSYRITEKILTSVDTEQISSRIVILMAGLHLLRKSMRYYYRICRVVGINNGIN